jgi:hypothetical protein
MTAKKNPFQTSMVRMQVPAHMSGSIAIGGFTLEADDGQVEVPHELVDELLAHGLTVAPAPDPKATAKK